MAKTKDGVNAKDAAIAITAATILGGMIAQGTVLDAATLTADNSSIKTAVQAAKLIVERLTKEL